MNSNFKKKLDCALGFNYLESFAKKCTRYLLDWQTVWNSIFRNEPLQVQDITRVYFTIANMKCPH